MRRAIQSPRDGRRAVIVVGRRQPIGAIGDTPPRVAARGRPIDAGSDCRPPWRFAGYLRALLAPPPPWPEPQRRWGLYP